MASVVRLLRNIGRDVDAKIRSRLFLPTASTRPVPGACMEINRRDRSVARWPAGSPVATSSARWRCSGRERAIAAAAALIVASVGRCSQSPVSLHTGGAVACDGIAKSWANRNVTLAQPSASSTAPKFGRAAADRRPFPPASDSV
jgi:hypothetical protein